MRFSPPARVHSLRALGLGVLLGVAACDRAARAPDTAADSARDSAAAHDDRVVVRDSGGIEIVTTREPRWDRSTAWRLGADPSLTIGDAALEGVRVVALARLADGRIAVGDGVRGRILIVDSGGSVVRRLDGSGVGGPFRGLFWVGAAGDTVLAYDLPTTRLARFPDSGRPTAVSLRRSDPSIFTPLRPLGFFADGTLLAVSGGSEFPFPGDEHTVRRDSAVLLRYGAGGRIRDTLQRVPWSESFGVATGSGARRMMVPMPRPYGRTTNAVPFGDRFYVATADAYEISVHDTAGRAVRYIRLPAAVDSLPAEAVDTYRARVQARVAGGDSSAAERALLDALDHVPFPAVIPAYERVTIAADGMLWVLDASPMTRETIVWRVFEPGGAYLGVVTMPSRFVVHEIGADYVLGVWSGDEGGREVRVYPLIRDPAAEN